MLKFKYHYKSWQKTFLLYFLKFSNTITNAMVIAVLPATQRSHCNQLKKLNVSKVKNRRQ